MSKVILASASPRRQELLKKVFQHFTVCPSDLEETLPDGLPLEESAVYLAQQKALKVASDHPDALVIGCDTVVLMGDTLLGKPRNETDAYEMLSSLSGKIHRVITGVCLWRNGEKHCFSACTQVEFYPLTPEDIREYVATGEPFDKAGAYGIQGQGALLVKGICGDYYNVMGLPVSLLKRALIKDIPF